MKKYQTGSLTQSQCRQIGKALERRNGELEVLLGSDHDETSECFTLMDMFLYPDTNLIGLDEVSDED